MKKLVLTLAIGIFFVSFSNAQTADKKTDAAEQTVEVTSAKAEKAECAPDCKKACCADKKAKTECKDEKAKKECKDKKAKAECSDKKGKNTKASLRPSSCADKKTSCKNKKTSCKDKK